MANRYSVASGLASAVATWDGGTTVPGTGDRVLICSGHTVTLDSTYEWGDDSTGSIVINSVTTTASIWVAGTLKASRSVSSQLTCNGHLMIAATGSLDFGKSGDAIPIAYTSKILLNKSAALTAVKYGMQTQDGASLWMYGAARKRITRLTQAASAADTTIYVSDATGWQIGDRVLLTQTDGAAVNHFEIATIKNTYTPGATTVPITAGLTYAHASQCVVANCDNNVVVKPYNTSFRGYANFTWSTTQTAGTRELAYASFEDLGNGNTGFATATAGVYFNGPTTITTPQPWNGVSSCCFLLTTGTSAWAGADVNASRVRLPVSDCVFAALNGGGLNAYGVHGGNNAIADFNRCLLHAYRPVYSAFEQGFVASNFNDGWLSLLDNGDGINGGTMLGVSWARMSAFGYGKFSTFGALVSTGFDTCKIGSEFGLSGANLTWNVGSQGVATLTNCSFGAAAVVQASTQANLTASSAITVVNKNGDVSAQEIYTAAGTVYRDNSTINRSRSSIKLIPTSAATASAPHTYSFTIPAPNGVAVRLIGYCQFDNNYGNPPTTYPTVTISGAGITPVVYTATSAARNAWEKIDLTATQTSGSDATLTVTLAGVSNTPASGQVWFNGLVSSPFVSWAQHYGFSYDPTNPIRTADSLVVLSEAAASALAGISYAGSTLTITGTLSMSNVYDWMKWYEASNRLAPILTSSDGKAYTLAANLSIGNGASITGTGTLTLGANTLTMTGTAASSVDITHSSGAKVWTRIAVAGLVSGSRVRVYDSTASAELYNGVVAATSLEVQKEWSANHTLDVRVAYCSGTTAYLPYEAAATFGASGASITASQSSDTVYNTLAIDGSSCDSGSGGEFSADYPDVWVDVSDSDNTTSFQRLYAWMVYTQSTSQGIVTMFDAITSSDGVNFTVNSSIVNLHLYNVKTTPLIINGGYLYRSDGATVIAATSNSIQLDPGRAFVAPTGASDIATAVWNKVLP